VTRPASARLSAPALLNNLQRVRHYAPDARVMAIVKANGYGHGLHWVAQTLQEADGFGVASAEEGASLRALGIRQPVTLLEGFFQPAELPLLAQHRLTPAIHHESQLWDLEHTPGIDPFIDPLDVWVKIDTGMHRLGFAPAALPDVLRRLAACPAVRSVNLMTHFANADNKFDAATKVQTELFLALTHEMRAELSLANSAGIVAWPASHRDWVRPGIMLYGASPVMGQSAAALGLQPVMTLRTEIIAVHQRRKGETVGYGGDWMCPEDMPVGVAAIGYGDGYPRHAPAGTPVLVQDQRLPLIGRVSMDMITIDLRTRPDTRIGDPVTLWGEGLAVDEIAERSGTIAYELLCCVTERVPRHAAPAN
jgi:alanine racemase